MRPFITILIVMLSMLLLAGAAVLLVHHFIRQQTGVMHRSTGPSIEQIRMLQHLVTAKVAVTDVMTTTITGHTGSMDVVIAVKGELSVGVDLASARLTDVDETRRHAVLVLPDPTLLDAHIDHARSRVIAIPSRGLWQVLPADPAVDARVIDTAYAAAQRQLETANLSEETLEKAGAQAEKVLGDFVRPLGWKLDIQWQSGRRRSCGLQGRGTGGRVLLFSIQRMD